MSPTGFCVCNEGYGGDACDQCANNFYRDITTNVCTGKLSYIVCMSQSCPKRTCILECPPGWFSLDQSCYFIHGQKLAFDEAKAKCQSLEAKLFEPMSEEENEAIFNIMLSKYGEDTEYYVGISIQDAHDGGRSV